MAQHSHEEKTKGNTPQGVLYFDEVIVEKYEHGMIYFRAKKVKATEYSYHATGEDCKDDLVKISSKFLDCPVTAL